jgi:hypothetical protein
MNSDIVTTKAVCKSREWVREQTMGRRAMYAISPIGDTDGQFFTPLPHNPARSPIALAKKV